MIRRRHRIPGLTVLLAACAVAAGCDFLYDRHPPEFEESAADQAPLDSGRFGDPADTLSIRPQPATPPRPLDAAPAETDPDLIPSATELAELSRGLVIPVQGVVPSQLRDTYTESRGGRQHEAIDILAPRGTPVLSATDGRLLKLFDSKPGGLMVYATDASGKFILLYGHMGAWADGLIEGQALRRGEVIGYVGTTGNAPKDTPHLHFGILRGEPEVSWSRGVPLNPYPLFVLGREP